MRYYCNICRKDITKVEFLYSVGKFDIPLCREHQAIERNKRFKPKKELPNFEERQQYKDEGNLETQEEKLDNQDEKQDYSPLWKKAIKSIGKGIVKGTKSLISYSKETIQVRKWKEQILREMSKGQLIQICNKHRISTFTKYTVSKYRHKDDLVPDLITKQRKSSYDEIISRVKNRLSLNDIISFAKSRNVPIRNIIADINRWEANKEMKKLIDQGENLDDFYYELVEAIQSFTPFRRYNNEEGYQIDLARHLKSMFPNTKIEESRGSTRPDIVTRDIAIEVKGPTFHHDLRTISDKCMRYCQHYTKGMIVVLFDLSITQRLYDDFMIGMKNKYPEVKVIVLSSK